MTVNFCSYNCRGWRSGSHYVSSLLNSVDFLFVQEHWLLPELLGALDISDEFVSVSVSGIDNSEILAGRPYGGCGIMFRKSLSSAVCRLKSCSKRFCALSLILTDTLNDCSFIILLVI